MPSEKFIKVHPLFFKHIKGMKPVTLAVLSAVMLKVLDKFESRPIIWLTHEDASGILLKHRYFTREEIEKFTSSRFSEGIRDLIERGLLERTEKRFMYKYNRNYFKSGI